MVYLDNAATSWPKPPGVAEAMVQFLEDVGANPGRSGHTKSVEAARIVYAVREKLSELFHAADPLHVVLGSNATEALNLALLGLLRHGDHVITSGMEHNSVMRPLRALEQVGVTVTTVPCSSDGRLVSADVEAAITENTRLIVMTQASNVVGTILPVAEVGRIAHRHGLLFLVDAAQSAGVYPIDMVAEEIDLLAFTGHKGLLGPTGTGGLVIGDRVLLDELKPLKHGGTGSLSEREEQPRFMPDAYESGTPNAVGLAGLNIGVGWVLEKGVAGIRSQEVALTKQMIDGLLAIPGVTVYGPLDARLRTATISFNIAGMAPSEVGLRLDEEYGIMCRVGLHCAPAAHRTIGTFPSGTVRFSLSAMNTAKDVQAGINAVARLAGRK